MRHDAEPQKWRPCCQGQAATPADCSGSTSRQSKHLQGQPQQNSAGKLRAHLSCGRLSRTSHITMKQWP